MTTNDSIVPGVNGRLGEMADSQTDGETTTSTVTADGNPVVVLNGEEASNDVQSDDPKPFALKDVPIENQRPMRVVVIGAGFAGILAAIRIPERLRNVELVVYEKNDGVGGVWWMNRYPGVACDIPSHSYQYTFAPNPHWDSLYASGKDIQVYLQGVAERFGAMRFIKLAHRVDRCVWDEGAKKWKLAVSNLSTGETFEDEANVLISARGGLNIPAWPDIPGLQTKFKGKVMHSAEWDESYDFKNKKIGVIGNGSSAIQIIPSLQRLDGDTTLKLFMRSPTWVSPLFGMFAMIALGHPAEKVDFTPEERAALAADPKEYLRLRKVIEDSGNTAQPSTIIGTPMQVDGQQAMRQSMLAKLAGRRDLIEKVLPAAFAPGCRRLTPGPGFLEALVAPNVEVIWDSVTEATEGGLRVGMAGKATGLETEGGDVQVKAVGREIDLDVIVCATGFQTTKTGGNDAVPGTFSMVGRDGQTLASRWPNHPESYLSVAVDGFPNHLMVLGPNSAIGFGSLTSILEAQVDYACKFVRKLQREDYGSFEVRRARVNDFSAYVREYFKPTVYMGECRSWYRRGDVVFALWPGSTGHAIETLRAPRWEDYEWTETDEAKARGNGLAWLGNGWSMTQLEGGDPSWYLNDDEVDMPEEGEPEKKKRWQNRPWCY